MSISIPAYCRIQAKIITIGHLRRDIMLLRLFKSNLIQLTVFFPLLRVLVLLLSPSADVRLLARFELAGKAAHGKTSGDWTGKTGVN